MASAGQSVGQPKPNPTMRIFSLVERSTSWTPLLAIAVMGFSGIHAQPEWERGFAQRYDREQWYPQGDWFADETEAITPRSPRASNYDTRRIPTVASSRVTPFFYYWDPEIVGWSSAIPMTGSDTAGFEEERLVRTDPSKDDSVRIGGKIDDIRWMSLYNVDGESERHSLIRIRLEDGRSRMVSLGTRAEPEDLELRKGQDIDVTGLNATLDGRPIVIADRIEVREENVTLVGKVADFREVDLSGDRTRNLIIRMDLSNGERSLVDLGPGTKLADLNLEKGDRIQMEGVRQQIAGRPVIVAKRIRVDAGPSDAEEQQVTGRDRPAYTTRPPGESPND